MELKLIEKLERPRKGAHMKRFMPRDPTKPFDSRYVPAGVKREVWGRDKASCTYVSPHGKRCDSQTFLQLDHIHPWILGGTSHDVENLQVLCSTQST